LTNLLIKDEVKFLSYGFGWFFLEMADFYNWNRVKVRYCDGASFTGDVEAVNPVSTKKRNMRFI